MSYCSYCGKSVYSQTNDCPECGRRLTDHEESRSTGERKLPRIVGEEPSIPIKHPLTNNAQNQQPVYQHQEYQEKPQPGFQQQYIQPHEQKKSEKTNMMPIILIIIGGILAMISAVAVFRTTAMGFSVYVDIGSLGVKQAYFCLVPISGMLTLLFGIFGHITQKRQLVLITILLGIMALIIPLIFAVHLSSEGNLSFGEVFYISEAQTGFGFSSIFIGGILAMIGGIITVIGGIFLLKKTEKTRKPVKVLQPRDY